MDSIRARAREEMTSKEEVEETMRLWIKGRKRDIISATMAKKSYHMDRSVRDYIPLID